MASKEGTPRTHHLARELGTTSQLELADHESFRVVRRTALIEQPLRELVPVDLREQVLIGQVREELHRLLEERFHVFVTELFASRLEDPVAERRHELRVRVFSYIAIREFDEGLLERFLEERVAPELLRHDREVLVVQCQQLLDEGRVLVAVLGALGQARLPPVNDVVAHLLDMSSY